MKILITGCAGFIGTNAVLRFSKNHEVLGIDNLSRKGSEKNLEFLRKNAYFAFLDMDITKPIISESDFDVIIHLAAQVGVQKSMIDPRFDFEQNVLGTLNVLEMARAQKKKPIVIFASTNKVYGEIKTNLPVSETTPLDFHTPYGVSKGAADQYVLDYSRMFGIKGVVFRQSCIYGEHQLGAEEQGWISWFLIADHEKKPITIYGDGTQRRDVLHVDDLLGLYEIAIKNIDSAEGQAFNIGGGSENTLSLLELIRKTKISTKIKYADWRPADQKCYISNISKVRNYLGWEPKIGVDEGLKRIKEFTYAQDISS
jgi:CDP-paratose 2-epimerase